MREQKNRIAQEMHRNHANTDFEFVTVNKNGNVPFTGIRLDRGVISPVVYYEPDDAVEDIMERIQYALEQDNPEFDMNVLHDPDYILNHTYTGIQKKSNEDIVKKDCLNLEVFLKLQVDLGSDKGTMKINETLLTMNDLDSKDVWNHAIENSVSQFEIKTLEDVLGMPKGMMSAPFDVVVAKADSSVDGAAALFFPELFWGYTHDAKRTEIILIPSSREELLIVRDGMLEDSGRDFQNLARMVKDINNTCVSPDIALEPVIYNYELMTGKITIAGSACETESGVA